MTETISRANRVPTVTAAVAQIPCSRYRDEDPSHDRHRGTGGRPGRRPVDGAGIGHAGRAPELPVLAEAMRRWQCRPAELVLVTHLLDTAVPYVRALSTALDVERVIAVPYSVRRSTVELLSSLPVQVPASLDELSEVAVDAAIGAAHRGKAIVQEIGGYCAPAVDRLARAGVLGVVEDTKQGQWAYQRQDPLPLPVFTIADSPLKALEDCQVGRSIGYSVDRLLRIRFYRLLAECRVVVFGYGGIGTALVDHLMRHGVSVSVYDPDPVRMAAAVVRGVRVGERTELLRDADVVIGVSGHRSLTADDVGLLSDGVVLASASSKQVEFDVPGMLARANAAVTVDEVTELAVGDRTLYLLNDGKPVNFLEQSVLGSVLDLVYAELYVCISRLSAEAHSPGLRRLERAEQRELAGIWSQHYRRG